MEIQTSKIFRYPKPSIVLSKCLGISACRYNGHIILDKVIDQISPFMNFVPVCPEEEIGLGTPRDPIRLVDNNGKTELVQPKSGKVLTNKMVKFSNTKIVEYANSIDGFILKDRSPSCGISNVKVYSSKHGMVMKKSPGMFAEKMKIAYPDLPMENEGRLSNKALREHFLTSIFAIARYREIESSNMVNEIQLFHKQHKYLLMGYNQVLMRQMGKIAANSEKEDFKTIYTEYLNLLFKSLKRMPRISSIINIHLHNFGYFKNELKSSEKVMFLELLEKYRNKIVTQSTINHLLWAWIVRYEVEYLSNQYFFQPFPEELISLPDSGKDRRIG